MKSLSLSFTASSSFTHNFDDFDLGNAGVKNPSTKFPKLSSQWKKFISIRRRNDTRFQIFSSNTFSDIIQEIKTMRVSEIKKELNNLGIKHNDCFEKEELIQRLAKEKEKENQNPNRIDSSPTTVPKPTAAPNQNSNEIDSRTKPILRLPLCKIKSSPLEPREYVLMKLGFLDRGEFDFVLDTGSSATLVRESFIHDTLGIPKDTGKVSRGLGGMGFSGNEGRIMNVPGVKFGERALNDFQVVALDLSYTGLDSSVVGILGLNFLKDFDVDFNFGLGEILFYESGTAAAGVIDLEGMAWLKPAKVSYQLPAFQVSINKGKEIVAILDMGSSLSLINWKTAKSSNIDANQNSSTNAYVLGVDGNKLSISAARMDVNFLTKNLGTFEGKIPFPNVPITVGDLKALDLLNANMIVGLDLLKSSRVVISFYTNAIFFKKFV